jgi:hypothetical protein
MSSGGRKKRRLLRQRELESIFVWISLSGLAISIRTKKLKKSGAWFRYLACKEIACSDRQTGFLRNGKSYFYVIRNRVFH